MSDPEDTWQAVLYWIGQLIKHRVQLWLKRHFRL
jgi:hypothetical protein